MGKLIFAAFAASAIAGCSGRGGGTAEVPAPQPPPPVSQTVLFTEFVSSVASDSADSEPVQIADIEFDYSGATDATAYDELLDQ